MALKLIQTVKNMVPKERLELSRVAPPPPQDGVSTNSTTSAFLLSLLLIFADLAAILMRFIAPVQRIVDHLAQTR